MSQGINKVILVGNLGRDPELRYTQSGTAVANFTMATTERWSDRDGERQEHTEWHRIVCWGGLAEVVGEYLEKGRQVYVEGSLRTRTWEDQSGAERRTTEVRARDVIFLSGREAPVGAPGGPVGGPAEPGGSDDGDVVTDDDIPF